MERVGRQVDKARIKAALEDLLRQQSALQGRRRSRMRSPRNPGLERLKFWLGIPNSYYESGWSAEAAQQESPDESVEQE